VCRSSASSRQRTTEHTSINPLGSDKTLWNYFAIQYSPLSGRKVLVWRFPGFVRLSFWEEQLVGEDECEALVEWHWQGKTCPSATFFTINLTGNDLGSNPGFRGARPATNRLSHGTKLYLNVHFVQRSKHTSAVNTLRLGYKNQSVNAAQRHYHWDSYKTHTTVWAECRLCECQTWWYIKWPYCFQGLGITTLIPMQ
jgi:hypothetical protein